MFTKHYGMVLFWPRMSVQYFSLFLFSSLYLLKIYNLFPSPLILDVALLISWSLALSIIPNQAICPFDKWFGWLFCKMRSWNTFMDFYLCDLFMYPSYRVLNLFRRQLVVFLLWPKRCYPLENFSWQLICMKRKIWHRYLKLKKKITLEEVFINGSTVLLRDDHFGGTTVKSTKIFWTKRRRMEIEIIFKLINFAT